MIFFINMLLWFTSVIGMENDIICQSEPITLKELTLQSIFYHLGNKNITVADIKKKLPRDMIDEIMQPDQSCDFFKREIISITPNNRYMLTAAQTLSNDWKLYRQCLNTGQEICVIEKAKNKRAALSCNGNLVAVALSATKIAIKNLIINSIIKEVWSDSRIEDVRFIGNELVLAQNADGLSIISLQESDDTNQIPHIPAPVNFAGILHKKLEYLTHQQWSVQRYAKDRLIETISVGNLPQKYQYSFSPDVKPAIYEPQLLMAYKETRPKCAIVIISLQKEKDNPLTYLSFPYEVTAISFTNKGKWLITAGSAPAEKSKLEIWDWQVNKPCLFSMQFDVGSINEIFCTDQPAQYPCLIQVDSKLCFFDLLKTIAQNILKNELETA